MRERSTRGCRGCRASCRSWCSKTTLSGSARRTGASRSAPPSTGPRRRRPRPTRRGRPTVASSSASCRRQRAQASSSGPTFSSAGCWTCSSPTGPSSASGSSKTSPGCPTFPTAPCWPTMRSWGGGERRPTCASSTLPRSGTRSSTSRSWRLSGGTGCGSTDSWRGTLPSSTTLSSTMCGSSPRRSPTTFPSSSSSTLSTPTASSSTPTRSS
mmetsp:Transcript_12499/g.32276  ORF Transcript_12499/g.32276 Transcript_12499/m.32276 type:complete len:212 (+) Transcript_12499:375-1010(+)